VYGIHDRFAFMLIASSDEVMFYLVFANNFALCSLSVRSKAVEDVSEISLWFSLCCTDVSVGDVR